MLTTVERMGATVLLLAAALSAAACTSEQKLRQAELAQLAALLPGTYDDRDAIGADADRLALQIMIVPIYAPALAQHVFYSHETALDDPLRVTGQRLRAFDASKDGRIIERVYSLIEPARWRAGAETPDLFKSLMAADVRVASGCDLAWRKEGERFVGANDRRTCRVAARTTGGMLFLESRAEVSASELAAEERAYDANGALVFGRRDGELTRFARRSN